MRNHSLFYLVTAAFLLGGFRAFGLLTPEVDSARVNRLLKPISDEIWKSFAGEKINETYEIVKGDTLWDISQRLFGDPKYWPKIWALNNKNITNPHLIKPKNLIAFMPGSTTSLPSVAIQEAPPVQKSEEDFFQPLPQSNYPSAPKPKGYGSSQEWKLLPPQSWESVQTRLPQQVDPDGFDRRSKITFNVVTGFELVSVAATEALPEFGEIIASRSAARFLGIGDTVYIDSEEKLQAGEVYAVTYASRTTLSSSGRSGYSYPIIGKVAIQGGSEDGLYVGRILTGTLAIERGFPLIKLPPRIKNIKPIPGPEPVVGTVLTDKKIATPSFVQHKQVFIDRGSEDGIQPGMVFRVYQYRDPSNRKTITDRDFIIDADILVVQVSELFSACIVIRSLNILEQGAEAVLLTDVSDLLRRKEFADKSLNDVPGALTLPPEPPVGGEETLPPPPSEEAQDDLDGLDQGGELTPEEERELRQLEQHKEGGAGAEAPPGPAPEVPPETAPLPESLPEPAPEPSAIPPAEAAPPAEMAPAPPPPPTTEEATEVVPDL